MDMKHLRQKVRTLWETKGYILVIALCAVVLGGTALATRTTMFRATPPPIETPNLSDESPWYGDYAYATTPPPTAAPTAAPAATASPSVAEAGAPQQSMQVVSLVEPVEGTYGLRFSADMLVYLTTLDAWGAHMGLDIQADEGQAVRAVADGTVDSVTDDPVNGVCVVISHPDGISSRYMGLSGVEGVSAGGGVTAGQIIGRVGVMPSERDEGPHLHFELWGPAGAMDPEPLLTPLNK